MTQALLATLILYGFHILWLNACWEEAHSDWLKRAGCV